MDRLRLFPCKIRDTQMLYLYREKHSLNYTQISNETLYVYEIDLFPVISFLLSFSLLSLMKWYKIFHESAQFRASPPPSPPQKEKEKREKKIEIQKSREAASESQT